MHSSREHSAGLFGGDESRREATQSTKDRVKPHVFAHFRALLLIMHEEATVLPMLAFLLGLGSYEETAEAGAGQFSPFGVSSPDPFGGFLTECLDQFVFE